MPKWRKWVAQEISGFWEMCILVVEENWIFLALSLSVDLCLPCAQSLLLGNKTFLTWGWHSHPRARQVAAGKAEQLAGYGHMGVVRSVVHSKNTLEWRRQLPLSTRQVWLWVKEAQEPQAPARPQESQENPDCFLKAQSLLCKKKKKNIDNHLKLFQHSDPQNSTAIRRAHSPDCDYLLFYWWKYWAPERIWTWTWILCFLVLYYFFPLHHTMCL